MAQILKKPNSVTDSINQDMTQSTEFAPARSVNISRAPSPTAMGSNPHGGSALATEIDSYRRRIQTLLHFFDCIGKHWWDHLYPYKKNLIKRPSKSADDVRSYRSRLISRLNKFTMRTVIPAAAAIATIEAHATVKVLPPNLLSPVLAESTHFEIPLSDENSDALLRKACNLARRLGDIEKLKQKLILAALTWITSDGRDFTLRAQRVSLLVRHAEPCLIENYSGLQALLTHYYRPRILASAQSPTRYTPLRMEPITAARLTSTNEQIVQAVKSVCLSLHQHWPITPNVGVVGATNNMSVTPGLGLWNDSSGLVHDEEDVASTFSMPLSMGYDMGIGQRDGRSPVLPSLVLNPLSIDTSQLDWLSYEINHRDFNLHVLNLEEPEDFDVQSKPKTLSPSVQKSSVKRELAPIINVPEKIANSDTVSMKSVSVGNRPYLNLLVETPIASPDEKDSEWSGNSHEYETSDLESIRQLDTNTVDRVTKRVPMESIPPIDKSDRSGLEESSKAQTYHETQTTSHKSDVSPESSIDIVLRPKPVVSPGGEGEILINSLLSVPSRPSANMVAMPWTYMQMLSSEHASAGYQARHSNLKTNKRKQTLKGMKSAANYTETNQSVTRKDSAEKPRIANACR